MTKNSVCLEMESFFHVLFATAAGKLKELSLCRALEPASKFKPEYPFFRSCSKVNISEEKQRDKILVTRKTVGFKSHRVAKLC